MYEIEIYPYQRAGSVLGNASACCPKWNQRPRPTQTGCNFFGSCQGPRHLLQKVRLRSLRVLTSPGCTSLRQSISARRFLQVQRTERPRNFSLAGRWPDFSIANLSTFKPKSKMKQQEQDFDMWQFAAALLLITIIFIITSLINS